MSTVTFKRNPGTAKVASQKWKSLENNALRERYPEGVVVMERGEKKGRLHFHVLVALQGDVRTGFDWEHPKRSANALLQAEWAWWKETAERYGFGTVHTMPLRTNEEAVGLYVSKYVEKHIGKREGGDKGARLWRLWGIPPEDRTACARLAWCSPRSTLWRLKEAVFAGAVGAKSPEDLKQFFGRRWAYRFRGSIMGIVLKDLPGGFEYPSAAVALADGAEINREVLDACGPTVPVRVENVTHGNIPIDKQLLDNLVIMNGPYFRRPASVEEIKGGRMVFYCPVPKEDG
jgi:hypothetical protein